MENIASAIIRGVCAFGIGICLYALFFSSDNDESTYHPD